MRVPPQIPIRLMEDLHTADIGRCDDGMQFFLNEFRDGSTDVLVLYRFDADGNYHHHQIRRTDATGAAAVRRELLAELQNPCNCDIRVKPFTLSVDGVEYGLIVDAEDECVHLQPHSQITFMDPWDGEYYT